DPEGRLLYTETGLVSVHFMRSRRPPWSIEESPTEAERVESAAGYGAYAGRYTVEEAGGFVLHHVEVALIPNRVGRDLKRFFAFSGNRLTLQPPPVIRDGVEVQRSLMWEKE
ncbi:MAG: lipocalin-like domain-containing protein, partial [Acidobacteria bacterium]|nr:lipocalin-like domain-containing protein [Acidobacteriota bacterium]MCA1610810.1 lipocalin-like domain-containing protein [Acidobacteriota bacterium]